MKSRSNPFRLLFATVALSALASFAYAGSGPQSFETLHTESHFKQLKAGDQVLYVCNQCQTVTPQTMKSTAQAMEHCKEGAAITCPSCKAKLKVRLIPKQNRNDPTKVTEVYYTNEKGEKCFFVAKALSKN